MSNGSHYTNRLSPTTMDGDSDINAASKKRRVAHACDCCRKKKIKCDGNIPSCTNCINYKTECVFTYTEKKRNPPKGSKYIESLENRLERMEDLIRIYLPDNKERSHQRQDNQIALESPTAQTSRSAHTPQTGNENGNNIATTDCTPSSVTSQTQSDKDDNARDSDTGDINTILSYKGDSSSLFLSTNDQVKFIGKASIFSIFSPRGLQWIEQKTGDPTVASKIRDAINVRTQQNTCCGGPTKTTCKFDGTTSHPLYNRALLPLPGYEEAEQLLDTVNDVALGMFPIFSTSEVRTVLNNVYYPDEGGIALLDYLSLNALLALGLRIRSVYIIDELSSSEEEQSRYDKNNANSSRTDMDNMEEFRRTRESSLGYCNNVLTHLSFLLGEMNSIRTIQILLIVSVYLEHTYKTELGFTLLAAAVRTAQCLGLHVDGPLFSPEERILRKRIWWTCYIFDKGIALRYGRPPIISDEDVMELPEAVENFFDNQRFCPADPSKVDDDFQSLYRSQSASLFCHLIHLGSIQGKVYKGLYAMSASKKSESEIMEIIGELDREILEWRDKVPLEYRPDHEIVVRNESFLFHVVYIHLAYYNCIIAIHNISVHHPSWNNQKYDLKYNIHQRNPRVYASAALCVQASRSTLHLLHYFDKVATAAGSIIILYALSGLITLFTNVLQNPSQSSAKSDIELMNMAFRFIVRVLEAQSIVELREHIELTVTELIRLANNAVDKVDLRRKAIKRKWASDEASSSTSSKCSNTPVSSHSSSEKRQSGDESEGSQIVTEEPHPDVDINGTNNYTSLPGVTERRNTSENIGYQNQHIHYRGILDQQSPLVDGGSGAATPMPALNDLHAVFSFNPSADGSSSSTLINDQILDQLIPNSEGQQLASQDYWMVPTVFGWDWPPGSIGSTSFSVTANDSSEADRRS
ncbi:fungal-specific transcription factor domain-containing protein [Dipodascopsis uninucleata]